MWLGATGGTGWGGVSTEGNTTTLLSGTCSLG